MRRMSLGLVAVVLGGSVLASSAQAQTTPVSSGFSDPFFLYYGWFLPRQQYLANQPGPELLINRQAAARAESAIIDREGLFDPGRGLGDLELDPLHPFGTRSGVSRIPRPAINGVSNNNLAGTGPPQYFSRVGTYYPGLRVGRGRNINVPRIRRGGQSVSGVSGATGAGISY